MFILEKFKDECCDHQKENKKCDCAYCEVFGNVSDILMRLLCLKRRENTRVCVDKKSDYTFLQNIHAFYLFQIIFHINFFIFSVPKY